MVDVMYARQEALDVKPPNEASIVGCGGIGAWVGINLAMAGTNKLTLFDEDKLELHNLNRVPFRPEDVGKPKTEVLKKFIKKIRPEATVYVRGNVSEISKTLLDGVVIDCTDKLAVQQLIAGACNLMKLPYFRAGYDGHHLTVIDGAHKEAPKLDKVWGDMDQSGYTIVPSWIVPPVIAAAFVTEMICVNYRSHNDPSKPIDTFVGDLMDINEYKDVHKEAGGIFP